MSSTRFWKQVHVKYIKNSSQVKQIQLEATIDEELCTTLR